ncbi:MAG: putative toxin-antitoxin system toxin component, PIN family [Candidatus Thiosymbion ectosymbiont of Robbea hypermnestra]|nr:putative toxin-antitoxin system toxin component, PIN family [Candidatus Thiosymbion ectosymbiont of Robbea hypermnestra]
MRLVLDTNVLVSGFLSDTSPPARLLNGVRDQTVTPVISSPVVAEYRVVLSRPVLRLDVGEVVEFLVALSDSAWYVEPFPVDPAGFPDPSDLPFYATALAGSCPLVTGNRKHFPDHGPVEVLSPRAAVERLSQLTA